MYRAVIDEVHGMLLQISISGEDKHPRTDSAPENRVCHLHTRTHPVQGVSRAITVWDESIEGEGRAQEHRHQDQRTLHFAIMTTTVEGSGRQDQNRNWSS